MSALPATMTCVEITKAGGPEVLVPATRPVPVPKAGEILIKVAATGINRPDIAQRQGTYPPPPGASDLPGLEAAGTVAAVADGVTGLEGGRCGLRADAGRLLRRVLHRARTAVPADPQGLRHAAGGRRCRRTTSPSGTISSSAACSRRVNRC